MMAIGVIVNGTTYTFNSDTYGYITAADGFGMPPIDRFSERGAQQHGDSDLGYRLNARRLSLVIALPAETQVEFYAARKRLLEIFHPDNDITIKVTDDASRDRRIDTVFDFSLDMPLERDWKVQKLAVALKTSGLPAWYDPTARAITFNLGGGSGSFTVPMSIPHGVGSSEINSSSVINYAGTWQDFPRVRITGPISDCVVTNHSTGEKLDFTGFSLGAGHFIEINTGYGEKTVLYDGVTNYLDKLTAGSDLAGFHLAPAQENSFTVVGGSATDASKVEVFYTERYIGI